MRSSPTKIEFGTKAETLERLQPILRNARVLPQERFTVNDWRRRKTEIIARLRARAWLDLPLIVRSSGLLEDSEKTSLAGRFLSIPDVRGESLLGEAVEKVTASFGDGIGDNQIFVQPLLHEVSISGVAFTCDPSNCGQYFVINYDDRSGGTDTVTSGRSNDVCICYWDKTAPAEPPGKLSPLRPLLHEVEELFGMDALDLEFAFTRDGTLYLLQIRPLVLAVDPGLSKAEHQRVLAQIRQKIYQLSQPHPYLYGSRTVFGVMPDWNPAEIVGVRPRPLALSLYQELVTDNIWAYQRDNYGYRNLRSFPLLISFAGLPYIDVRVSFNSFVPHDIHQDLADRLVNHYIDRLRKTPSYHDKVEFQIIYSCYTLDLPERLKALADYGFSGSDCDTLAESLRALTNNIIHRETGLWKTDIERIGELERRRLRILESDLEPIAKIYWLLEDCKRYGTLPFAGLARAGFIAVQFLKSLVSVGILSAEDSENFMGSLDTISSQLSADLAILGKQAFLDKYGHLRPGTYDVLSLRYDEAPDRYFDWSQPSGQHRTPARSAFALSLAQLGRLETSLKEHKLAHDVLSIFNFIKSAIEGREYSKFVFTRSLSDAMALLTTMAEELGISRDDVSFADIKLVSRLYGTSDDAKTLLKQSIQEGKRNYEITRRITLPPLITSEDEVSAFEFPLNEPNYITMKSVVGNVVQEHVARERLRGGILMIPSADPGYDWIFAHGIVSFITMYGGANSHMAVRAGEMGIPAVIGAGEMLYRTWSAAAVLEINCAGRQVRVLR